VYSVHNIRPIATDRVALSVCLLVTFTSPAKMAKLTEMPFGWVTQVGPRNHLLDGVENRYSPEEGAILGVIHSSQLKSNGFCKFT